MSVVQMVVWFPRTCTIHKAPVSVAQLNIVSLHVQASLLPSIQAPDLAGRSHVEVAVAVCIPMMRVISSCQDV